MPDAAHGTFNEMLRLVATLRTEHSKAVYGTRHGACAKAGLIPVLLFLTFFILCHVHP